MLTTSQATPGMALADPSILLPGQRHGSRFARLLVPIDGSARAEQPLPLAVAIARAAHANLHLVWVHDGVSRQRNPQESPSTRKRHLEALTESASDLLGAPAYRAILAGPPAEAIVDHVRSLGIDLVVMGSRGEGGLWRLGLGSVTDAVLRTSPVPVLVLRATDEREPEMKRETTLGEIVVTLDGSDAAESALGPALELSRIMHAGLTLLRVVVTPPTLDYTGFGVDLSREVVQAEFEAAHEYLDRIAARLRAGGLGVATAVREAADAPAGILRFAREADAGLIALATRGLGRASRLLRGSTTASLLYRGEVPLLVVNPTVPGFDG